MKRVKGFLVVMLLGISATTFANGPAKDFGKKASEVVKEVIEVNSDPAFRRKGDKLYLNFLNLGMQNVTIKVYDSNRRLIFKETLEDTLVIEKAFNFEKAYEDNYTVVVIDNSETFREVVEIR